MKIIPLSVAATAFAFAIYTFVNRKEFAKKYFFQKIAMEIIVGTIFLYFSF